MKLRGEVESGQRGDLSSREDGTVVMGQRLCVPDVGHVRREIMEEAHSSAYAMHMGSTKMYHTLKEHYWWKGVKRDIAEFVSRCLTCQQVKAEHQKPATITVTPDPSVEMGENHYGFYGRTSTLPEWP